MADKEVVSFIRNALLAGRDENSIRIALLRKGYDERQIDAALGEAQRAGQHSFPFSPAMLGILVALLIAAAGFSYFIFSINPASTRTATLLDINLEPVKASAAPGEELVVLKEVTNMGSAKGYDVELRTELVNPRTGAVLSSKTETRAIETIGSTQTRIAVPATAPPGEYLIRTIAEYGDNRRAVASLRAVVSATQESAESIPPTIPAETPSESQAGQEEPAPQGCNDFNPCTADSFQDGTCAFAPITPCCGNGKCEQGENCALDCPAQAESGTRDNPELKQSPTLDDIKLLATTNSPKAMQECARQEIPDYRDSCFANVARITKNGRNCEPVINGRIKDVCFSEVAKASQDSSVCGSVGQEEKRDSCYITFALDYRDYSVCGSIAGSLKQSCFALKALAEAGAEAQASQEASG